MRNLPSDLTSAENRRGNILICSSPPNARGVVVMIQIDYNKRRMTPKTRSSPLMRRVKRRSPGALVITSVETSQRCSLSEESSPAQLKVP
ncbi:hypothetical protein PBY51_009105 [Eleginops maclovinus]|uniref:Uncharacterized protein n=1 Tax=Eleginops maclovinus TaxID=56733 RepID=A0AAN8AB43_ELEMC|nr:hypothetical protein PBY51_009105 [Eleginops maclovinus]